MVYALNGATDFLIDLNCTISEAIYENFINSKAKVQKLDSRSLSYIIGGGDGDTTTDPSAVTPIRGKNVKLGRSPGGDII
jgi:hypothetical protein